MVSTLCMKVDVDKSVKDGFDKSVNIGFDAH